MRSLRALISSDDVNRQFALTPALASCRPRETVFAPLLPSGRCSPRASSGSAVMPVSTSSPHKLVGPRFRDLSIHAGDRQQTLRLPLCQTLAQAGIAADPAQIGAPPGGTTTGRHVLPPGVRAPQRCRSHRNRPRACSFRGSKAGARRSHQCWLVRHYPTLISLTHPIMPHPSRGRRQESQLAAPAGRSSPGL